MSLNTLYGINGVGKDRVASELKREHAPDLIITSASRVSMYLLGITTNFDAQRTIGREEYKKLESVPQAEMIELEVGPYRSFVEELSEKDERVVMLSHLVFALYLDRQVTYLTDRNIPDWYVAANDSLVQLVASPEEVLSRRLADQDEKSRERPASILQIAEHQALCDQEWERIARLPVTPQRGQHIVVNSDLQVATQRVNEAFYG